MGAILLKVVGNSKSGSERPKGVGRSFSTPPGKNRDPTPSGDSSLTCPVSDQIQFGDFTIWTSGEAVVAGYGLGQSLGLSPQNRPLEKADDEGRGYLGG